MSGLLRFLPAQLVIFENTLVDGLNGAQRLLCMLAVFVLEFAEIEHHILRTLVRFSEVDDDTARALFSGVRADAAMDYVKRLLEVSGESEENKERYQRAFAQFKAITEVRNLILHYGLERSGESTVTTNKRIALSESRLRSVPVSSEMLENLVKDLSRIDEMLIFCAQMKGHQENERRPDLDDWVASFRAPWLYTPPQAQTQKSPKRAEKGMRKPRPAQKDRR